VVEDYQVNYPIVQNKIQQNVKYILSREIRQVELQNKVVIEISSYFAFRGKILNVEKAMHHKVFENEEIRNIFTLL
jgi:hypothetical protein